MGGGGGGIAAGVSAVAKGGNPINGLSNMLLGDGGSGAAGAAAMAQQAEARRQYNEAKGITDVATLSGIASFEKDLANQEKNLARQEQLIAQIDPTVIEASQQALKLLRGEQSSTLQPLQNQRTEQRQKLVNSLRQQLGPGAETSSAGIQALTKFDSESANIMGGAQQQAIGNMASIFGQFNSGRPDMLREISGRSTFGQGKSNLLMQQAGILQRIGQPLLQTAGAQYTTDVLKGQQRSAFGSQLLETAVKGGTAAVTGGMG